ncbi:MAG: kelch repeat-containing protein [Chloroflexota bacterium]
MNRINWIILSVAILSACTAPTSIATESMLATPSPIPTPTRIAATPATTLWKQISTMPSARSEMPAIELNGLFYVVGGFGPVPDGLANGKDAVETFEAYNPKADQWIALAPTPEARDHSMMTTYQGRIYVFGGYAGEWVVYPNAWMYDPAADQWTVLKPMPASRTSGAAVTIGDYIYLVGGITSQAHVILPTWRYDPTNDTWQDVAPLQQPREHVSAVVLNGLIYTLGGRWIQTLSSVEIYDPAKDQWTPGVPMQNIRAGFGATVMNGKIYVAGGEIIETLKALKSVEEFDPATQTWSSLPNLPVNLHGVPLAGFDNVLYAIGGSSRSADMINWGRVYSFQP